MKLTKFEHACFTVEKDGRVLVVDLGNFTTDFVTPENVTAIVITHEHPDHFDTSQLQAIIDKNPNAVIVAHESITSRLDNFRIQAVAAGEHLTIGNFELDFYGGKHAIIYPDIPTIANLGVMINDQIYYPGDSFTTPERDVKVLALPVAAPWMKISEAIDFARMVKPVHIFPTHDAILSDAGKDIADRVVRLLVDTTTQYQRLTEPLELA